jgi:hypothetical protein
MSRNGRCLTTRQPLLAELIARRELVSNFVVRNLKQR